MKRLFYAMLAVCAILVNIIFVIVDHVCIDVGMAECAIICIPLMAAISVMGKIMYLIAISDEGRKEMGRR